MKPENIEKINRSFEIQAPDFESEAVNFSKAEYLDYTIKNVKPQKDETILEVAAGTCACGRAFAPFVQTVVCLDATVPMLEVGKQAAREGHIENMIFVKGYAEELPFLDDSFDIVFSRLAFHHFIDTKAVFAEMARVLKPGGKLVMIDMEAAEEDLRGTEDEIETLRDPSHVHNLSRKEMTGLFRESGLDIQKSEPVNIRQKLTNWMALTKTPEEIQKDIVQRMKMDLEGGTGTGFYPYMDGDDICFDQRWVLTLGIKQ